MRSATLQTFTKTLRAGARAALSHLPGQRPGAVVVELSGAIAPRAERPRFFGLPLRPPGQRAAPSLESLGEALDALAAAPWVTRVVLRFEGMSADSATAYALRRRVEALREAGKHVVAYLSEIEWTSYYVATAASEIVAPPSADLALRGLGVSVTFLRDALAKVGVRFEKLAIDEYKNAFDGLTRSEMSAAHREQLEALLDGFLAHYTAAIAARRGLTAERVREILDLGLTSAEQARAEKLLDRVAYEDEVITADHKTYGEVARALGARVPPLSKRVALITLTGTIVTGRSRGLPLPFPGAGGRTAGSETLARALRAAAADPATAAVVFLVDSGGGSALASDLIAREVKRLRDRKPVVGVMGAVAASGGYYVLAPATRIIAAPTTITGSIGVITGKMVLADLFERAGVRAERVERGRYAFLLDPSRPLGDDERALLTRANHEIYERFLAAVAEGRKLDRDRVHELGRGRVWSGAAAHERGLVDELGDLDTALARARELGGLPEGAPVWEVPAPEELVLPSADPEAMVRAFLPLARETSWVLLPARFRVG